MSDDENSVNSVSLEINKTEILEQKKQTIKQKRVVKPRTENQLASLAKGRENRKNNIKSITEAKKLKQEEDKKLREEKIVKKAIAIKKKQIKKESILDDVSDDETPVEEIIKTIKKKVQPVPQTVPQPVPQSASRFVFA